MSGTISESTPTHLSAEHHVLFSQDDVCNHLEEIPNILSKEYEIPMITKLLPKLLDVYDNKSKRTHYEPIYSHMKQIISYLNPWFTPYISDTLSEIISNSALTKKKYAYMLLSHLIQTNSAQIKISMPKLVPMVSSDVNDIVSSIKESATSTLEVLLKSSGNMDLDAFTPVVLNGIKKPDSIYDCIENLASCVFVQNVEGPALAITMPVLLRGLLDKKTATRRLTCVIIDNMCKLI
jgi:elongation factor 3